MICNGFKGQIDFRLVSVASSRPQLYGEGEDSPVVHYQHRCQRRFTRCKCCAFDSSSLGAARYAQPDRNEVWLRDGTMRRVHRALRRTGGALLSDPGTKHRYEEDYNYRGLVARSQPPAAKSLDCRAGASVRLLSIGTNYAGRRATYEPPQTDARTNR